ncbi:hypothetical protein PHLCEN_2v2853 [Hermanssonia centrifuga]|uniref:(2E,6E)-farnesyl diphosphate synthase n=1 Tax=Hermanssonia centrifuga TaxID=98765 RepID=A0A2R6RI59_9APHY|nr:hypothetical protein PHLCEN_2v2853 [Hermanssonia centrifuga]
MLNLTNLRTLLLQVLSLPALHTAILFTPEGQLVSFASDSSRSKDEIRVVVGLSGEIWQETKEQGIGMVDSELGRLLVLPIEQVRGESEARNEEDEPMMLLALNADNSVRWEEMEKKYDDIEVASVQGKSLAACRAWGALAALTSKSDGHRLRRGTAQSLIPLAHPSTLSEGQSQLKASLLVMRRWSATGVRVSRQANNAAQLSSASASIAAVTRTSRKRYSIQTAAAQKPSVRPIEPTNAPLHDDTHITTGPASRPSRPDPHILLAPQLKYVRETLLNLLGSSHPSLTEIAKYYFLHPSKQLRPLLVLLFSQATNGLGGRWHEKQWAAECEGARGRAEELDQPLTRPDVLNDWNPNMPDNTSSFSNTFSLRPPRPTHTSPLPPPFPPVDAAPTLATIPTLLPTQMRLAQIVEMIHVASLLHDDVIDKSPLRRGAVSAPAAFGNKLSVLAGDFLLGRTSAALSRLGENEVVELIASVIANLVEGEILQLKAMHGEDLGIKGATTSSVGQDNWNIYMQKTYLKTASLMAKGARAAVVLGGCKEGEVWKEIAYAYGRNLGIAFQLVDDILDYEAGEITLGKPGGADLRLGLATGPALFAWEEHPELGPLIERKFKQEGDVELAREFVRRSSGVERTRDLARSYADKAREVLTSLPESDAKAALVVLTERVVKRTS